MISTTNPFRLTRSVVPSAYRLFLSPDLEGAVFSGRAEIDVELAEPQSQFTLNAVELVLGAASLTSAGTSYRSSDPSYDETYQTATFAFDETLPSGPATIEIAFSGILNDLLRGFYRSTFTDETGTRHTIATTQFEECDARRAFPCWDEPSFKATFQVNLTIPSHLSAYSNSPVISETDFGNGKRTVSFSPTMIMSTYVVAFVVGPFEETDAVDVLGTPLRIVYPKGKGDLTELAMESAVFALEFFSDYFDIPYPGEKLDMIAIPDFAFGAMENLGCITYREPDLLVDRARASHAEIQRVATVIAHEVAHMWFGDLVTMQWWEGIWLNEAFATFMEVLCTDAAHPEWRMWVDFGVERDIALQIDGLHSTRPIEFEVISPVDSLAMIDTLTYEKGGSVLRMLEQYLGQEVFRDSIRRYLRQHSYANAVSGDLWNALEVTSGLPIGDLMNSWILQGGHPLVTYENGLIRQEPFAYGPARGPSAIGSSWIIPVRTRSLDGGPSSGQLLGDVALAVDETAPVVLNAGGSGVFRSQYGAKELSELVRRLGELEELERTTLVADSWALLFADRIPWTAFLSVVEGLGDHDEPSTWSTVTTAVGFVNRALRDVQRDDFVDVVRGLFAPQFLRLGWEAKQGEGALAPQMRALAIATLGTLGRDEAIRGEAVKRFEANEIEGDLANAILGIVADQNRPGDYDTFLERYRQSPNPQEERRYLHALASFSEEELALDAARRCFGEFRNQDAPVLLGSLSRNIVTGPAVWRVVAQRWPEAMEKFPAYLYPRLALGVSTFITDDKFAEEVEAFYAEHSLGAQQRKVNQEIEKMRVGLAFTASIRQQF